MRTAIKKTLTLLLSVFLVVPFLTNAVLAEGLYTDSETGITFTIPDGWEAIGLSKEDRQVAKERFSTGKTGEIFVYLSANLYDQLPDEYKKQLTRDSFDGYRLTESDAKELFNGSDGYDSYTTEIIGEEEWYVLKNNLLDYYVQYINGNMIGFTISKVMSEERIKQVKGVIEEVTKTEVAKENKSLGTAGSNVANTQNNTSTTSMSLEEDNARLVRDLFIWIGIAVLFFFIKSKWKKKDVKKEYIKCSKCGTENDSTNKFCTKCGEPLQ